MGSCVPTSRPLRRLSYGPIIWSSSILFGFAIDVSEKNAMLKKMLTGKSARIIITMGMPALIYRWYFGAHSLKSLERNILGLCGIKPVRESLIGMVDAKDGRKRIKWLDRIYELGRKGR